MIQFWYKLVVSGAKTLEDVPEKWREAVRELLEGDAE